MFCVCACVCITVKISRPNPFNVTVTTDLTQGHTVRNVLGSCHIPQNKTKKPKQKP